MLASASGVARLAEDRLGEVAGQQLGAGEDQDRDHEQRADAQRQALGDELSEQARHRRRSAVK